MLELAFSRRMCCSRAWSARRYALSPLASRERPMMRPGTARLCASWHARNAAWGPPYPRGTPKRWELPRTMSAPMSPGGVSIVRESRSATKIDITLCSLHSLVISEKSAMVPSVAGYGISTPSQVLSALKSLRSPTMTSMPMGSARTSHSSMVCGLQRLDTKNLARLLLWMVWDMAMPSAAAVASSRREDWAIGMPVRSATMVW
mmetsp:Transcript_47979/g.114192  ORF Transcript_47979/g.114192 Transcript_47979/m.114192 type:complete len:204 (+) Transcript_47979:2106-2717(+)